MVLSTETSALESFLGGQFKFLSLSLLAGMMALIRSAPTIYTTFIIKCDKCYRREWQVSSQSVTSVITKCDNFITTGKAREYSVYSLGGKVLENATIISKYTRTVSPQQWSIYVPTISQMHCAEVKKQSQMLTLRNTLNSMPFHLLDHKRLRALTF